MNELRREIKKLEEDKKMLEIKVARLEDDVKALEGGDE